MKESIIKCLSILSAVIFVLILGMNNTYAQLNMAEKEQTQTIVWVVELLSFITTLAVVIFVWKMSKRDQNARNNRKVSGQTIK